MNPVGPEEPSVYWRRRAIVVVALLVVLWLAWMLVRAAFGGGGDQPAAAPGDEPSAGISASPDPSVSPAPASSPAAGASGSPSVSPGATACADDVIGVTATAAASSTGVGAGLALSMTVTNTSEAACTRDVGAGANELRVISGPALVWSSDFCNPSSDDDVQVLEPGQPWTTTVTWPGTITPEGCPSDQRQAQPGSYQVIGRNGAVESEPVAFTVE
jgi:hypothetical protein